jgi:hypothetical protein
MEVHPADPHKMQQAMSWGVHQEGLSVMDHQMVRQVARRAIRRQVTPPEAEPQGVQVLLGMGLQGLIP